MVPLMLSPPGSMIVPGVPGATGAALAPAVGAGASGAAGVATASSQNHPLHSSACAGAASKASVAASVDAASVRVVVFDMASKLRSKIVAEFSGLRQSRDCHFGGAHGSPAKQVEVGVGAATKTRSPTRYRDGRSRVGENLG